VLDDQNSLSNYPINAFDELLSQEKDFVYINRDEGYFTNYIFISVKNFNGDHVGYFVFSEKNNEIVNLMNDKLLTNFLLGCFWLTIVFILIYVLNSRSKTYQKSMIDYLTGVNNFKGFSIKANLLFESAKRFGNFWICFIDIDDFKKINDTYGHSVGDTILIDFANILTESFRSSDVIGRIGGDEFVVCGICKQDECGDIFFERIEDKVNKYNELNINKIDHLLQFSYGFSQVNDYAVVSFEDLLNFADQKMYMMKSSRKK
jgi:diguanylate cyclase (GGDEF)-like protein